MQLIHEIGNLIGEHTGLARTRTGYHQLWAVTIFYSLKLTWI